MRHIDYIIIHCTATSQKATLESIKNYWHKTLGWKTGGYHFLVFPNGTIERLYPISTVTNGVQGFNSNSIHISYVGGIDASGKAIDNRTTKQKESILVCIKEIYEELKASQQVDSILIRGHRDFSPDKNGNGIVDPWERLKECPCFEVLDEYWMWQGSSAINKGRIIFK